MKSGFSQNINFKLILIHCLAGFILTFAVSLIGYINDVELVSIVEKKGVEEAMKEMGVIRMSNYSIWFYFSPFIGLLTSTLISSVFFIKKKLFWFNSILVFFGLLLSNYFGLYRLEYTKYIAYQLNFGLVINVIVSSSILIILSILLYYFSFKFLKKETS